MKPSTYLIDELFSLAGKTALVTGAHGFLGRHFSRALLDAGARVILVSRSTDLKQLAKEYSRDYGDSRVSSFCVDFYDKSSLRDTLKEVTTNDRIDILVNNAFDISARTGFNDPSGKLEVSSFDQWSSALESGIYWAVSTSQIIGDQMKTYCSGSIINISSMYGLVSPNPKLYEETPFFNPPSYGVAKAGLIAFTRYVAAFWGKHNIRCNSLVAGAFSNTEYDSYNAVKSDDPFLSRLRERTLLGRIGAPRDLIGALIFLASDASEYMTGQTVVLDGGWTVT